MEKIAIYGAGVIGAGEATLIIGHGIPCLVIGHSAAGMERCRNTVVQNWDDLIAQGLATEKNKQAALELLTLTNDPKELAGCTFVFEAVPEDSAQKQAVFQQIETYAAPTRLLHPVPHHSTPEIWQDWSHALKIYWWPIRSSRSI